jgi:hypothetical protein
LVEEAAAAAESLQDQAAKLAEAVSVFKLEGTYSQRPAAPVGQAASAALPKQKSGPSKAMAHKTKLAVAGGNEDWEEF